jgi:hypothetical protein
MTGRLIRLATTTAAVVLTIGGLAVALPLAARLPRPVRREITEVFLRLVLIGYAAAVVVVPCFVAAALVVLGRGRRRGRRHVRLAKLTLLGVSGLLALVLLEGMAAAWEWWSNRMPALPTKFAETAPAGSLHIVVIGGSSALGEPFRPWLSVGQILQWKLGEALPARRIDLTILARLGASLKDMHAELANLRRRPDLLVIYSGHNEFVARYEEERDAGLSEEPAGRLLDALYHASLRSPFCRMAYQVISRNRLDGPPPRLSRHKLIDPPQCTPSEYAAVRADFGRRLEAIVAWCESIGGLPLLIIPPSNEGGLEPSRSVLPPSVGRAERARVVAEMNEIARIERDEPARAALRYRRLLEHHPGFAEARFRLARLEQRAGSRTQANRHYILARDHDGLPIRCPSDFQQAYRDVAERHPAAVLVDGPAVLRAASPSGVLDDHMIQDAHHPTLAGMVALAEAALRRLHARRAFGWSGPAPEPLDGAAVAAHFGMDAARWIEVCNRTRIHYERIALYRFDPSERLARARAYEAAMRRIAAGTPPEEAGVVGLGVRAKP